MTPMGEAGASSALTGCRMQAARERYSHGALLVPLMTHTPAGFVLPEGKIGLGLPPVVSPASQA